MPRRFGNQRRAYAQPGSHPWITFTFNLASLSELDFVHIGEALSKCEHIAGVPLHPAVADQLHRVYLVKGIHATTHIEGNSLTEEQVSKRVAGHLELPDSQEYLGKEVDNILAACNLVANELEVGKEMRLSRSRIEQFNAMVLDGLPLEEGVTPGKMRTKSVVVGGGIYRGAPAQDCKYLTEQLCAWLDQLLIDAGPTWRKPMGLIRAILAHLYLAWIHPFGDGNGRTARLVEFQLLLEAGFPSPACHLLSNYYNQTRVRYYQVLRETSRSAPYCVEKFISYALLGFVEGLREALEVIRQSQLGTVWLNFVHNAELGKSAPVVKRRRDLVLALPSTGEFTPVSAISRLTPGLAAHYAGKTPKMITRDVHALEEAGLLQRGESGVRPFIGRMLAFLPLCNQTQEVAREPSDRAAG
jgi:Fic family protein